MEKTVASTILGSADFVNEITEKHLNTKRADRNVPALKALSAQPSLDTIIKTVMSLIGEDDELSKKASIYLCHRYSGAKLKEIGERFNIGESAVSQASRRLEMILAKEKTMKKKIDEIAQEVIPTRNCSHTSLNPEFFSPAIRRLR
ncbi:MAG: hypothetical protein KAT62_13280 [Desulfuromonadales bacterium]|nr:hypothetical protein [Desulfuromonadales bacterium]